MPSHLKKRLFQLRNNFILRYIFYFRSQSNAVKLCMNTRTKLLFASLVMMENILPQVIMVSHALQKDNVTLIMK